MRAFKHSMLHVSLIIEHVDLSPSPHSPTDP